MLDGFGGASFSSSKWRQDILVLGAVVAERVRE